MASSIDPGKPTAGTALTADVRANFAAARAEIEALQNGTGISALAFATLTGTPTTLAGYGILDALPAALKGAPSGLAELDAGGRVPLSQLPAGMAGALSYQGIWDAEANLPPLAGGSGEQGHYLVVAVAGSTELDGIADWAVGDWAVFNGAAWEKIDNSSIQALADDPAPQLGADLDPNGFGIDGPVPKARAAYREVSTTSGTTTDADINGIVACTNGSATTITIHAAAQGAGGYIAQEGAGQVTVEAASGTLRYPSGEGPKTAEQYSGIWWWSDGTDIHLRGGTS